VAASEGFNLPTRGWLLINVETVFFAVAKKNVGIF